MFIGEKISKWGIISSRTDLKSYVFRILTLECIRGALTGTITGLLHALHEKRDCNTIAFYITSSKQYLTKLTGVFFTLSFIAAVHMTAWKDIITFRIRIDNPYLESMNKVKHIL